jgi:hypothetical protein
VEAEGGCPAPAELVTFDSAEWAAAGDALGDWQPAFRRWAAARRAWIRQHPDSELGDQVDLLIGEVKAKRQLAGS